MSAAPRLGPRLAAGSMLGGGSFAFAALLDLAFAGDAVAGARESLYLAAALIGPMACVGALVGAAMGVAWPVLRRRYGPLLAVAAGAALGWKICSGVWVSRFVPPLMGAAILGALTAPCAMWAAAAIRAVGTGVRAAPLWAGIGLGLYAVDAWVYRPLYPSIHLAVFVSYAIAFALAFAALRPLPRRPAVVLAAVLALLAWTGAGALQRSSSVRFAAFERSNAARKVLAWLPLPAPPRESPRFLRHARAGSPAVATPAEAVDGEAPSGLLGAHVVVITIDALRADRLGLVRDGVSLTPHLDDLARGGVRFERAYAQAPHSSFSLASLHVSDYVHSTIDLRERLPPSLAETLATRGYRSAAFYTDGVFFTGREKIDAFARSRFGFTETTVLDLEAPETTAAVIDEIARRRAEGEPSMFLWVHYFDVHEPYVRRAEFDHGSRSIDAYDSEVAFTDRSVGRLIAALAQLSRPTVVVVTADHGEEFKEHGGVYHGSSLYDEQVRVPLIVAAPGLRPRVVADPVELVDVAPTLLRLVGVEPPASMRGDDLGDMLLGHAATRPAFSEVDTKKMVVRGRYKLIHDFRLSTWELYDLAADPRERINLVDRMPGVADELRGELDRWFDRMEASVSDEGTARPASIALGRMGDRRAVAGLSALVGDPGAEVPHRAEAARLLGKLQDKTALPALWKHLPSAPRPVADEIAIAAGELFDQKARAPLAGVVGRSDATIRARAGIALGKLGDRGAAKALLEAVGHENFDVRRRAVHYLGMIGGAEAIDTVLELSSDPRLRYLCTLALGRIGGRSRDPRVLPYLLEHLGKDQFTDVRGYAAVALGFLGDARAVPDLVRVLHDDPEIKWTAETLVRLGGVGRDIAGTDLAVADRSHGVGPCHRTNDPSVDAYMNATWCEIAAPGARVHLSVREPEDCTLLVRARALLPEALDQPLTLVVNGVPLPEVRLSTSWEEFRLSTTAEQWKRGRNEVVFHFPSAVGVGAPEGRVGIDHVLLASGRVVEARE